MKKKKDEDPDMETRFFNEYVKLGGKKDRFEYDYYTKVFTSITLDAYVGGESPLSREESFAKWIQFVESEKEAVRIFRSIDNIAAYS